MLPDNLHNCPRPSTKQIDITPEKFALTEFSILNFEFSVLDFELLKVIALYNY